jgi:hypothetical protein
MDRGSSKHGPRLDELMAKETQGIVQGSSGGGRAEEWHESEPDDRQRAASARGGAPAGMSATARDERSRLGQYLRRTAFPAGRGQLLDELTEMAAPVDVVALVSRLPDHRQFRNVAEVWACLEDSSEGRLEPRF